MRSAGRVHQGRSADQLLVDPALLCHPQAVGDLDDTDSVEKSFIGAIIAKTLPLGLIRMSEENALERDSADVFGAQIIALLRRSQQGMQHLDRRLEHLAEFEDSMVCLVEAARKPVGIWIVLAEGLQLADIDLANQRRDVLVVVVSGFGFGDRDLLAPGREELNHTETLDIAAP